jgi:hypothetical protein
MHTHAPTEIEQTIREMLRRDPPKWVQDMVDHYHRTGEYRPEDIRRLLGDPSQGVRLTPDATLESVIALSAIQQSPPK